MGRYHIATGKFPRVPKTKKVNPSRDPNKGPDPGINFRQPDNAFYLGKDGRAIPVHITDININHVGLGPSYTVHVNMSFNITPEQAIILARMVRDLNSITPSDAPPNLRPQRPFPQPFPPDPPF